jgi:hypothetical protein
MEGFRIRLFHGGEIMQLSTLADAPKHGFIVVHQSGPELSQVERIIKAVGSVRHIPKVGDESLSDYYRYLATHLDFPFVAYYPKPATFEEEDEFRCTVLELLDPAKYLGDRFDGIFCKVRKGQYEVNLPLIELYSPEDNFRSQLIEDYWYWFWNWR